MKKNYLKTALVTIIFLCIFVACKKDKPDLISISINTPPVKVDYFIDDTLDINGLVVTLAMDNGETRNVNFTELAGNDITCFPENGTILNASTKEVKIKHINSGISASQVITVSNVVLSEISIKTTPKIDYYEGDVLDLAELIVTLTMNNGETEDVVFADFLSKGISCSPLNGTILNSASTMITITHTGKGIGTILPITVSNLVVNSIGIKTPPTKLKYSEGNVLDLSGLVLTVYLNNGNTRDIDYPDFSENGIICSPENGTILDTSSAYVSITYSATGMSLNQYITVLEGVKDVEGNTYSVVEIGSQIWMGENLKTTRYNDDTPIPLESDPAIWTSLTTPSYCWYNNNEALYKDVYGALYNWYAVNNEKLCPIGWHIPNDTEWNTLTDFLGGLYEAGGKLKAKQLWYSPNLGANNSSGFTALPGGIRTSFDGTFNSLKICGYWWSLTESFNDNASHRNLYYDSLPLGQGNGSKKLGLSVRCLKD